MSDKRAVGLQLIIVLKIAKVIALVAFAIAAFVLAESDIYATVEKVVTEVGLNAGRPAIRRLLHISNNEAALIGIGSLVYAAVFAVEAWGLHRRKVWAEWFTVVVTTSFIPFEVYELVEHTTAGKAAMLVANIAAVIYLVIRRLRDR